MPRKIKVWGLILLMVVNLNLLFSAKKTVTTEIKSQPSGVTFIITGTNYDSLSYVTPKRLNLRPGNNYTLIFTKPGYKTKTINHVAGSGRIFVELTKIGSSNTPSSPKTVTTKFTSTPSGATFVINGTNYNNLSYSTPKSLNLRPNHQYQIVFSYPGYQSQVINHTAGSGRVHADLAPDNPTLTINSNIKKAKVFINGQKFGKTPYSIQLSKGTYKIQVTHPGYTDFVTRIELTENQSIFAKLKEMNNLTLILPKGASVWINGEKQKVNFDKKQNTGKFTFYAPHGDSGATVKVRIHGLVVEEYLKFNNQVLSLGLSFK
ncbi:MAG: PEGA domain-containing protein [Spirochaetes bacterium]|nr:PEGA domain-containing protein [Spirochaetota bacterium]